MYSRRRSRARFNGVRQCSGGAMAFRAMVQVHPLQMSVVRRFGGFPGNEEFDDG